MENSNTHRVYTIIILLVIYLIMTSLLLNVKAQDTPDDLSPEAEAAWLAAQQGAWGENVSLELEGERLIIKSDGLPNHEILDVYQAISVYDDETVFLAEPLAQRTLLDIPLNPIMAEEKTPTYIGAIGIAISGALFYGPFEANGTTVALDANFTLDGIPFIDACNGHPNPFAVQYHYHGIPYCITDTLDVEGEHSRLLGYLLDGFPVYGPQDEGGVMLEKADLDECFGHFGATPEYPDGVYHYHILEESPYMMPCYSGEVELSYEPLDLLSRLVDPAYPPVIPPLNVLTQGGSFQPAVPPTPSN